ncbi:transcription factor [Ganoderma sinense ZZ0214-1]|uniref:Transcription factor n=1 Tax=Ganoderma sinense ZZ0214-1 TaxID=1077348 RepID=A0A2G8S5Z1_9APHY|nr:transcription factor [Ganoderma sinense ZZ0214-1]
MTPSTSPTGSQRDGSVDHSPPSHHASDRPERSRNAKAQARHRAKRKAYIEQLEQTVTKLQSVLALSPDQVAAIPPPLMRIRELEQENELLHREVEELRRQLEMKNSQLRPDFRRDNYTPLPDDRHFDRESKRRRTADVGGVYVTSSPHTHSPPPPLSIPSITGQYSSQGSHTSAYPPYSSRPLGNNYSYGVPGYPVPPETPTSSATSSPSFSASVISVSAGSALQQNCAY